MNPPVQFQRSRITISVIQSRYVEFLPSILNWIADTLRDYAGEKRPVASFRFRRLPRYFSPELLNTASVVITHPLPVPPLTAMGLNEFAAFERQPMAASPISTRTSFCRMALVMNRCIFTNWFTSFNGGFWGRKTSCCYTPLAWPNGGIRTAHWRRWHTDTSIDSTFGGRRIRSKRTSRRRRWLWHGKADRLTPADRRSTCLSRPCCVPYQCGVGFVHGRQTGCGAGDKL